MKIKRFTATSMRDAMRQVREELGPEAMILSNRRTDEGVEVVAATDYDAALLQQQTRLAAVAETPTAVPPIATAPVPPPRPSVLARAPAPPASPALSAAPSAAMSVPVSADPDVERAPVITRILREPTLPILSIRSRAHATVTPPDARMDDIRREMRSLRAVLETRAVEGEPARTPAAQALRALLGMNLSPALAHSLIADHPPAEGSAGMPLGPLARRIPLLAGATLAQGVFALVGPTGVGKTTTVAKMAAYYAKLHGTREVALISTDTYRIGAQEQLHTYARLLGVPVLTARGADEVKDALARLSDRRVVLLDTAGLAPRDERLAAQLQSLGPAAQVRRLLVLPAGGQHCDLEDSIRQFGATTLTGCILTKLDEAARIGGALSAVVRNRLPLAFVSDGQRVPEDLHVPQPFHLVVRAQQLVRQVPPPADERMTTSTPGAQHVA